MNVLFKISPRTLNFLWELWHSVIHTVQHIYCVDNGVPQLLQTLSYLTNSISMLCHLHNIHLDSQKTSRIFRPLSWAVDHEFSKIDNLLTIDAPLAYILFIECKSMNQLQSKENGICGIALWWFHKCHVAALVRTMLSLSRCLYEQNQKPWNLELKELEEGKINCSNSLNMASCGDDTDSV